MRARQQLLHHGPHGGGAQHQRFLARAGIEHAVGEDMAALEIGAELDLVDGEKGDVKIARHRLDGGDPIARIGRLDLLLAGDQRHRLGADAIDHLVVDLARQQPQRQPDHAGGMRQHALDGEMGLAGIGRAQDGGDAGTAGSRRSGRLRGERNGHYASGLAARLSPRALCTTMLRRSGPGLSFGTSLERTAPESLTPALCRFVHGDIWLTLIRSPLDRVAGVYSDGFSSPPNVNGKTPRGLPKSQGPTAPSRRSRRRGTERPR